MNLNKYIGEVIEFQDPEYLEGDRLQGRVVRVHNNIAIVDVDDSGDLHEVTPENVTGTG